MTISEGFFVNSSGALFSITGSSMYPLATHTRASSGYYTPNGERVDPKLVFDEFVESEHPRSPDGKFTDGAGGSSSGGKGGGKEDDDVPKPGAYGGLWKASSQKTPEWDYLHNVTIYVKAPPQIGIHYRRMLAKMLKDADKYGVIPEFKEQIKSKLVESLQQSAVKAVSAGKIDDAAKLSKAIEKLGGKVPASLPTAAPTPKPAPAPVPAKTAPPPAFPAPTEAELAKAKKTVALQLQYVPNGGQVVTATGQAEANKLVAEFNTKYANKEMTSQPALIQKVNDFKALNAKIGSIAAVEKQNMASIVAKEKAAAAEKAKALAEKAAAEAKENAKKNAAVMAELGIDEKEAEGFNALVKMMGGDPAAFTQNFKKYGEKAASFGYPITGFQAALIANYSDGGYAHINAALRSGAWDPAQHVYVKMVNKALSAMPPHPAGAVLTRNTSLDAAAIQKYTQVGKVVQEEAFMSTSTGSVFSGNVTFKVTSSGKRGASIKKLSNHPTENEVLYQARTFFKIDKVEKSGGHHVIHMTEWED